MNDIKVEKAKCWCKRLDKLMKERNYTQKTFLKEYREKYKSGTQANISRWLRVGNKIENGKTIGFPSYDTMLNLANFFGVSVGYLTGETDYESFEMEKVCEFLELDEETVKAIKGITSGKSVDHFGEYMANEYKSVLHYLLTASSFPLLIKEAEEYIYNVYQKNYSITHMEKASEKINKDLLDLAIQCMDYQCISDEACGETDDFKENNIEPTEELLEAIHILKIARDDDYIEKQIQEQNVELSEYKLLKIYFDVIKELIKEDNLLNMIDISKFKN